MIHIFKSATAKLWTLAVVLIVLSALLISFARLTTPLVAKYRAEVERFAAEQLGQPVSVGQFSGEWRGLGPELVLSDISLLDRKSSLPNLTLPEVRIQLALIDSLRNWAITTREVRIIKPKIRITRHLDGSFSSAGLDADIEPQGESNFFLLPSNVRIEQGEILWVNLPVGHLPLRLTDVNLNFRNTKERRQLNGDALLPNAGMLSLSVDMNGALDDPNSWSGEVYLQGDEIDLGAIFRHQLPLGYAATQGGADFQVWASIDQGKLSALRGGGDWHDVLITRQFDDETPTATLPIDQLAGDFSWQRQMQGWRLDIGSLEFESYGTRWPVSSLALSFHQPNDESSEFRLASSFLRVQDLLPVIPLIPLESDRIAQPLEALAPSGDLLGLQVAINQTSDQLDWKVKSDIKALNTQAWNKIPGVSNLSGTLHAHRLGGEMVLKSDQLSLSFVDLFRDPLFLEKLDGTLNWHAEENGDWTVESEEIVATNADVQTRTRLSLLLPKDKSLSPFLDLQTDFHDGDGTQAEKYYPVGIMLDDLVRWLDRSIVSGDVTQGSCLFRGRLADFPFKENQGRFEVFFHAENAVLDYMRNWPRLEGLSTNVRFLNARFDAWADNGNIYNSRIEKASAKIKNLFPATALKIDGQVVGPFSDTLKLLRETPLADRFADFTEGLKGAGKSRTALDFDVPLRRGNWRLDGKLDFLKSQLTLTDWNLPLKEITGSLLFDLDKVHASDIKGRGLESAISVDVETHSADNGFTRITGHANVDSQKLMGLEQNLPSQYFSGSSDWSLQLDIPHKPDKQSGKAKLTLSSALEGVSIDLPPPLGKAAELKQNLRLSTLFTGTKQQPLSIAYGELFQTALLFETTESGISLKQGELALGPSDPSQRQLNQNTQPGLKVSGHWPALSLDEWVAFSETTDDSTSATRLPPLDKIDIAFDQLTWGNKTLKNAQLNLEQLGTGWRGNASGDNFSTALWIPNDWKVEPIAARFDRLDLEISADQSDAEDEENTERPDPKTLPTLDVEVAQLNLNGKAVGQARLMSEYSALGQRMSTLSVEGENLNLAANGDWELAADGTHTTKLAFDLNNSDFGTLIEDLGFTRNLDKGEGRISGEIRWDDAPHGLQRSKLDGQIDLVLKDGQFLSVEPGIGRVFGLLNLNALQRRLSLDFKDFFNKGFAFDRIGGRFYLDGGDAYTSDFEIKGPSANIEISGRTGLAAEDFDQLITVSPKAVSSALPIAGAIAGGPAVGAALFVAQKVLGDELDKATQIQYIVTGPWSDPKITPRKIPNETAAQSDSILQPQSTEAR